MNIGDKVRFLNEEGGGVISGFQKNGIALVKDEDGFEIPVQTKELVVVVSDDYNIDNDNKDDVNVVDNKKIKNETALNKPKEINTSLIEEREGGDELSMYLAFIPKDINNFANTSFEIYLINDSNFYVDYIAMKNENNSCNLVYRGTIEPNTKELLSEFTRDMMNNTWKMQFQGTVYKVEKFFMQRNPICVDIKFDPLKFCKQGSFKENLFFDEDALLYTIVEKNVQKEPLIINKDVIKKTIISKQAARKEDNYVRRYDDKKHSKNPFITSKSDEIIVDLHANEILDNTNGMSASDILAYQINVFNSKIKEYQNQKGKKLVFIHGKGEGILRQAIINELKYKYKNYIYQDASFQEYGYGATQITIK